MDFETGIFTYIQSLVATTGINYISDLIGRIPDGDGRMQDF